jgi:hypothetical protein
VGPVKGKNCSNVGPGMGSVAERITQGHRKVVWCSNVCSERGCWVVMQGDRKEVRSSKVARNKEVANTDAM